MKFFFGRVRHPIHVLEAALPFDVFGKLIQHPLTAAGVAQFLEDWQKAPR